MNIRTQFHRAMDWVRPQGPRLLFGAERGTPIRSVSSDLLREHLRIGVKLLADMPRGGPLSANVQAIHNELESRAELQK